MKSIVICLPRTQSSRFVCTLGEHYKIKNYGEELGKIVRNIHVYKKTNSELRSIVLRNSIDSYVKSNPAGFIFKFFPRWMFTRTENNIFDVETIVQNISDSLKLSTYDSIFLLNKSNLTNMVCSLVYGLLTTTLHKRPNGIYNDRPVEILEKYQTHKQTHLMSIEYILIQKIKNLLVRKNFKFQEFIDDDTTKYLTPYDKPNLGDEIATGRNYSTLVIDYDNVDAFVKKTYLEYENKLKSFEFF